MKAVHSDAYGKKLVLLNPAESFTLMPQEVIRFAVECGAIINAGEQPPFEKEGVLDHERYILKLGEDGQPTLFTEWTIQALFPLKLGLGW